MSQLRVMCKKQQMKGKSTAALTAGLVFAAILMLPLAAGCGDSGPDPDSPGAMLKEYYRLLEDDQVEAAYDKLSEGRRDQYFSTDDFAAHVDNGEEQLCSRVQPFKVERKQGGLAEVNWKGECGPLGGDTQETRSYTEMLKQEGEWKVDMNFIAPASDYDY